MTTNNNEPATTNRASVILKHKQMLLEFIETISQQTEDEGMPLIVAWRSKYLDCAFEQATEHSNALHMLAEIVEHAWHSASMHIVKRAVTERRIKPSELLKQAIAQNIFPSEVGILDFSPVIEPPNDVPVS